MLSVADISVLSLPGEKLLLSGVLLLSASLSFSLVVRNLRLWKSSTPDRALPGCSAIVLGLLLLESEVPFPRLAFCSFNLSKRRK